MFLGRYGLMVKILFWEILLFNYASGIERPSHYVSNSEQSRLLRRKIVVVGAGNGGCLTALHLAWYSSDDVEIELIYNPDIPPESVGQATTLAIPGIVNSPAPVFFKCLSIMPVMDSKI